MSSELPPLPPIGRRDSPPSQDNTKNKVFSPLPKPAPPNTSSGKSGGGKLIQGERETLAEKPEPGGSSSSAQNGQMAVLSGGDGGSGLPLRGESSYHSRHHFLISRN